MSESKRRQFTPEQKTEIVLAGLRGDRSVRDVCRHYEISETQYHGWRERLLQAGKAALADSRAGGETAETKGLRWPSWSDRSGRRPTSWKWRGKHCGAGSEKARGPVHPAIRVNPA